MHKILMRVNLGYTQNTHCCNLFKRVNLELKNNLIDNIDLMSKI